jgi:hypothetical protein
MTQTDKEAVPAEKPLPVQPNTLVMYKGGGYDGCFWEWNYCFISPDGVFHDIASSGYNGIKDRDEFIESWEGWHWKREQDRKENRSVRFQSPDYELYYLGASPDEHQDIFTDFADAAPISHLIGVAKWFNEHNYPYEFKPRCDVCEERFSALDGKGTAIRGCGGVAMEYGEIICSDCADNGTCSYCGEYVEAENMAEKSEEGYCKWCHHKHEGGPDPDARPDEEE